MLVVADALIVGIAAGHNVEVKVVEDGCSFDECVVVVRDDRLDGPQDVFVAARSERIRLTGILLQIVEDRGVVLGDTVALTVAAVEVVIDGEARVALLTVAFLGERGLGPEVRLVLPDADGHQVVGAVVEERLMWRRSSFQDHILDARAIVDTIGGKTAASEVDRGLDDVHGGDHVMVDSWLHLAWPVDDVRNAVTSLPRLRLTTYKKEQLKIGFINNINIITSAENQRGVNAV